MSDLSLIPPILGVVGIVIATIIYFIVKSYDEGDESLQKIADHKQASEELQTSDDYVQTVIESTVDGILVVDMLGNLKHANNRFMDLWHIPD